MQQCSFCNTHQIAQHIGLAQYRLILNDAPHQLQICLIPNNEQIWGFQCHHRFHNLHILKRTESSLWNRKEWRCDFHANTTNQLHLVSVFGGSSCVSHPVSIILAESQRLEESPHCWRHMLLQLLYCPSVWKVQDCIQVANSQFSPCLGPLGSIMCCFFNHSNHAVNRFLIKLLYSSTPQTVHSKTCTIASLKTQHVLARISLTKPCLGYWNIVIGEQATH